MILNDHLIEIGIVDTTLKAPACQTCWETTHVLLVECTRAVLLLWRLGFISPVSGLFEQAEQCLLLFLLRHTLRSTPGSYSEKGSEKHTNVWTLSFLPPSKAGQYVAFLNWLLVASPQTLQSRSWASFQPVHHFSPLSSELPVTLYSGNFGPSSTLGIKGNTNVNTMT